MWDGVATSSPHVLHLSRCSVRCATSFRGPGTEARATAGSGCIVPDRRGAPPPPGVRCLVSIPLQVPVPVPVPVTVVGCYVCLSQPAGFWQRWSCSRMATPELLQQ